MNIYRRTVAAFTDTDIASNGFEIAEFQTAVPDKLIVRNSAGLSYVDGSGDNIYTITANPWYQDLTMISLNDIANKLPVYHPATYKVIEADPCIECGDLVSFTLNGITNTMPIMSQTIVFTGRKTSAIYGSTGNAIRSNDETIENLDYSINVANNTGNIIKAIYAHGIDADYITTGKITDRDGNYSLDLENGTVNMANANITGGNINIETSSAAIDKIALRLKSSAIDYEMLMSVNRIQSDAKFHRFDADGNPLDGYGTEMRSSLGYGGASANVVFKDSDGNESGNYTTTISGTRVSTLKSVNGNSHTISELGSDGSTAGNPQLVLNNPSNGNQTVKLDASGIVFKDTYGNVKAKYPSTPSSFEGFTPATGNASPFEISKYFGINGLPSNTGTVQLGILPYKPKNLYAVLPTYSVAPPYTTNGSVWINSNGFATLYKQTATTGVYCYGTYVCN